MNKPIAAVLFLVTLLATVYLSFIGQNVFACLTLYAGSLIATLTFHYRPARSRRLRKPLKTVRFI